MLRRIGATQPSIMRQRRFRGWSNLQPSPKNCGATVICVIRVRGPVHPPAKRRQAGGLYVQGILMSKAFIAQVIQDSAELTGVAANRAAGDLMAAIVQELKKNGKFTLPSFGTFTVRKTKARKGLNPRTGEQIKVKAGKTVRFKASPTLKKSV